MEIVLPQCNNVLLEKKRMIAIHNSGNNGYKPAVFLL